jgi:hypothetical protein
VADPPRDPVSFAQLVLDLEFGGPGGWDEAALTIVLKNFQGVPDDPDAAERDTSPITPDLEGAG